MAATPPSSTTTDIHGAEETALEWILATYTQDVDMFACSFLTCRSHVLACDFALHPRLVVDFKLFPGDHGTLQACFMEILRMRGILPKGVP